MASLQNGKLKNGKLTKWQVDKLTKWQVYKMASGHDGKFTKWQVENGKLTK
jgi:hypothetical protein